MAAAGPVPAPASGILLVWTNVDPAHEDDFNRWYDREHMQERVRIQGIRSAIRYRAASGPRRYLGLYEAASVNVFRGEAYRRAFQHQTPWSLTNFGRMSDSMRRVCTVATAAGFGHGAWLAVMRLDHAADPAALNGVVAALHSQDGIVATRLLVPDPELSTPLPAENTNNRVLDPILLIEATHEPATAAAARSVADASGGRALETGILHLLWQLSAEDLPDSAGGSDTAV